MNTPEHVREFEVLLKDDSVRVFDQYEKMLKEYILMDKPTLINNKYLFETEYKKFIVNHISNKKNIMYCGNWIYYKWKNTLVHCLEDKYYYVLRTTRNNNLVTRDEHKILKNINVGVIGLSVGQSTVITLVISGISRYLKLADPDTIDASNLNRIHAGIDAIGQRKTDYLAKIIYDIDPYTKIKLFPECIKENNINDFLLGGERLDFVIDTFDDIKMKFTLRINAKKNKIPVLMCTDIGDSAIIDVERYDIDQGSSIFNGRVSNIDVEKLPDKMSYEEIAKIASVIIGQENISKRMYESIKLVGNELSGHPQLGLASFLGASAIVYAIKKIALGNKLNTGRYHINLDEIFNQ
ncbi:MAG: ThiF family adenylyltransferase [Patescibacteria group bacterium]|nr:ThiF family adenylyltransferase [Patescibacteria group bacterium]